MKRAPALRWIRWLALLALAVFAGLLAWSWGRHHPEDMPWTPLDLGQPIGAFTGRKLAGTHGAGCRALLARAGIHFAALPARSESGACGYDDAVRLAPGGAAAIAWQPAGPATRCPVAAALALWEWHVVQPAALARLGSAVREIEHFGSYNCRHMVGHSTTLWSEHAHANAIDIAGFRLEDGRRITIAADWRDRGAKGRFLHQVRDGACPLFSNVLSPDYNDAHHDHLHLDEAHSGAFGLRGCS